MHPPPHFSLFLSSLCQIENEKLRQVLKRELGDDALVEKALAAPAAGAVAPAGAWRGRAQQVITLKEKARGPGPWRSERLSPGGERSTRYISLVWHFLLSLIISSHIGTIR